MKTKLKHWAKNIHPGTCSKIKIRPHPIVPIQTGAEAIASNATKRIK